MNVEIKQTKKSRQVWTAKKRIAKKTWYNEQVI